MDIQVLIFRWSTIVQLTSLAMIAVFFAALTRTVRLANLRWWILAWVANVGALAVAVSFWFVQPQTDLPRMVLRGLYMGGKTAFVVFLIQGAWELKHPGRQLLRPRTAVVGLALYAVIGAVMVDGIDLLGVVQQGVIGILFAVGSVLLLRGPAVRGLAWLATGFVIRSVLSFVESASYAVELFPAGTFGATLEARAATFSAAHSSFDSGTEWLIALGCVLALTERTHRELVQYNDALLQAQAELRQIADRDPLTGLANRRTLRAVLQGVRAEGATLLFFDLDGFKEINDLYGHQAGDECLLRFANALRDSFRPDDSLIRYAGDEFLVVAAGLDSESAEERIGRVRSLVETPVEGSPAIHFSVGRSRLEPGGEPDVAVHEADESMYRAKARRQAKPTIPTRLGRTG